MTIAIAGASGFVGRALIQYILDKTDWNIIAISRSATTTKSPRLEWRQADLFSAEEVSAALKSAHRAYFLVHSMLPSANLDQGSFEDYDLLLADNFARACEQNKIEQVIYLGGILPEGKTLSPHLRSRYEVEEVFRKHSFALTTARAGLILGTGGSSFNIMYNLINRLPILVCPNWVNNPMTPIDLHDVVSALVEMAQGSQHFNKTYDIGGPKTYTYYELLKICAALMKKRRLFLRIPFSIIAVSRLWVRLFSGASKELVYPLLNSLKSPMQINENQRFKPSKPPLSFEDSVSGILESPSEIKYSAPRFRRHYVRSVQRMKYAGRAHSAAIKYVQWLPQFLWPLVRVKIDESEISLYFIRAQWTLLKLKIQGLKNDPAQASLPISGGLLVKKPDVGWLEFRKVLDQEQMLVAIHNYYPSLPWIIYRYTQALIHLWVMANFARHLAKESSKSTDLSEA